MEKFKNQFRIPSARLQNWDYSTDGAYFITICTQNREHFFGEIISVENDFEMKSNQLGVLAEEIWFEIPTHFPFIELDEFVVMPNHIHGILMINHDGRDAAIDNVNDNGRDAINRVSTTIIPNDSINGGFAGIKNPMFHENISRVIRWYKGRCSFEMRKINAVFSWQSRFYNHIIRDAQSFERIQNYIFNNPSRWAEDDYS